MVTAASTTATRQKSSGEVLGPTKAMSRARITMPATFGSVESRAALPGLVPS